MPETISAYLTAILYFTGICTCTAISESPETVTRDRLTGMLKGSRCGHESVETALKALFKPIGGCPIIDGTVVGKPYPTESEEASRVRSDRQKKSVSGIHLVLCPCGRMAIPKPFCLIGYGKRAVCPRRNRHRKCLAMPETA